MFMPHCTLNTPLVDESLYGESGASRYNQTENLAADCISTTSLHLYTSHLWFSAGRRWRLSRSLLTVVIESDILY